MSVSRRRVSSVASAKFCDRWRASCLKGGEISLTRRPVRHRRGTPMARATCGVELAVEGLALKTRRAIVLGLIIGALLACAGLWSAAELHYRGCIESLHIAPPLRRVFAPEGSPKLRQFNVDVVALRRRVAGCSRLPW
jgi:hypothetical protein